MASMTGGDLALADALIERSLAQNPNAAQGWMLSGWIKNMDGRYALALQHFDKAGRIDPRSSWHAAHALAGKGCALICLGRYEEATPPLMEAAERLSDQNGARVWLAAALAYVGRTSEARARLSGVHEVAIDAAIGLFRKADGREAIRAGLELASRAN